MQVSHVEDHCTHAIIGGGAAIEATISQDASFFHMLSATLYSDQPLAVVREVLCNAWDAHIEAGRKDMPLEVTLEDNVLTVKDFGKGIHRDDIGFIYLNYGGSTKKHDGNQTGGFGLGCKAPWAYVDHFEVTSCHAGVKSIYRMIKSCPEAQGKPSAKPVGSFATSESGLTVRIQMMGYGDSDKFMKLIRRIAFSGDIPIMFNGELLTMVGFDSEKCNFILRHKDQMPNHYTGTSVALRYGNVVYPVIRTPEWSREYDMLMVHLNKFKGNYNRRYADYAILFQAPPHSITVTPSRETLSMQTQTTDTLKKLVTEYLNKYDAPIANRSVQFIDDSIEKAVVAKDFPALITRKNQPASPILLSKTRERLTTVDEMAELALITTYPDSQKFRVGDVSKRVRKMVAAGMLDRGLSQTFLNSINKDSHHNEHWLTKRVLAPLMLGLKTKKVIGSLHVYDREDNMVDRSNRYTTNWQPMCFAVNSQQRSTLNSFPFLRNIVVVTHVQKDIEQRVRPHAVFKKFGWHEGFLVFITSGKKKEKEDALAFFNASGMVVVDMTVRQPWEPEYLRAAVERKPKIDGVIQMSNMLPSGNGYVNTNYIKGDSVTRMDKPEFILSVSLARGESTNRISGFDGTYTKKLVEIFGKRGGVTNMGATCDKYIKSGVPAFHNWLAELICDSMLTNPNIQKYYASSMRASDVETYVTVAAREFVRACFNNKVLAEEYGLWVGLSEEERFIVTLYDDNFLDKIGDSRSRKDAVSTHLKGITQTKEVLEFYKKVHNNHLLNLIDSDALVSVVTSGIKVRVAECISFIKTILK
jgi:hypothetical protein